MIHAYLAQHESNTLAHSGTDGKEHACQRQLEGQLVVIAASQHGNGNTGQRDYHGQNGGGADFLTQREPGHDGGRDGRQRHEQLTKLGSDDNVALEQAVVTDDIAHQS